MIDPRAIKERRVEHSELNRMLRNAGVAASRPGLVESDAVGKTILQQMGGPGRLAAMLGVKHFAWLPNGVQFKWPNKERAKGNAVRITLRPDDTYDMEFITVSGTSMKPVKKYEGVYNDQLIELFEKWTGWYLSIGGGRKPRTGTKPGPEAAPVGTKHENTLAELSRMLDEASF